MQNRTFLCFVFVLFLAPFVSFGQDFKLKGQLADSSDASPMIGATIVLTDEADTTKKYGALSDDNGAFVVEARLMKTYRLRISYIGYRDFSKQIVANKPEKDLGLIKLGETATALKDVVVQAQQSRATQNGDTVNYNANAFKTNPDANAQDLVTKMPGVTLENGKVKAGGEEVKQILVDGKPFFGDDPNMALKNLPAEVIDKIQVYDRSSDQSASTRVDDGNSQKTINIITKPGMNNGQFGKIYAGAGADQNGDFRYQAGGNLNLFKGDRRISILAISNNLNQQNFDSQDLLGALGSSSGGGRGMGMGGSGGMGGGGRGMGGPGGMGGGGNDPSNLLVGQQGGINTTHAVGLNYSDSWGKKMKVSGSYFFNAANNENNSTTHRTYISSSNNGLIYSENNQSSNLNFNQRFNFRWEYTIDSMNSIIASPRFSWQKNNATSRLDGGNVLLEQQQSLTQNQTEADQSGYNLALNALYAHRFAKVGRSFTVNLTGEYNRKDGNNSLNSTNAYLLEADTSLFNQQGVTYTMGSTIGANFTYSEPIGKKSAVMINYFPSYTRNESQKQTYNFDALSQTYETMDTALSNVYQNNYQVQRGGLSWRYNVEKLTINLSANYQYGRLSGDVTLPEAGNFTKNFHNFLPMAMLNYKPKKGTNLRVFYRTYTQIPDASKLIAVINNSNPLLLSGGNPDLTQSFSQMLGFRFGSSNAEKATGWFVFAMARYQTGYIANSTFIPLSDTVLSGVLVRKGAQLTRPVNLDGFWDARTVVTRSMPISKIKSNLGINAGVSFTQTPGLINEVKNLSQTYNFNGGFNLSSNISKDIDFNINYNANYNLVQNTQRPNQNSNYFYHTAQAKLYWNFWKGLFAETQITNTFYNGLSAGYNLNFQLWNFSMGYKFMKDRSLEAKLTVYDLLNQNNSLSRTVTETYIEDQQTTVLNRYVLVTVTYNLKRFKGAPNSNSNKQTTPPASDEEPKRSKGRQ